MNESELPCLIVDDGPDQCWALEHVLADLHLPSQKAFTGRAALELVQQHRFQFAFLDVKLPDMDGLQLARLIHNLAPEISLVMISGFLSEDDAEVLQALATGVIAGFLQKPFLHSRIRELLGGMPPGGRSQNRSRS
ncbi:MAG: response regulator [Verrucomicrobiota bacterium]